MRIKFTEEEKIILNSNKIDAETAQKRQAIINKYTINGNITKHQVYVNLYNKQGINDWMKEFIEKQKS
jgi:hypothetical protein